MPVLNKKELERWVADAVDLLDRLLLPESESDPNRPTAAVNSFFISQAKGLIFTWSISGGVGVGVRSGRGFAIAKVDGNRWSAPCFVNVGALAIGALAGVEKVDTLLVAETEKAIVNLSFGQECVVGKEVSHVVIPGVAKAKSRLDLSDAVSKGNDLYSISFSQGLTVNFSFAGGALTVDDDKNKAMFGEGTTGRTTLSGLDPTPDELAPLVAKINDIVARGK
ncbi:hypothetical protein C2E21_7481 [Chlorella sorokiniana]|uniref:Ysc84 actin-binding domain-containing protein n=1 Tax=Chlorella sorokiniana TaxID=3076 RepID=A0A2P6THS4_CHLSO|nr:hypothetical protein C2E21_7481 [Chlorella sorokiniana]|eukprot:PRW33838.1 hypothetical protein C2E21_7481 [Chlorella sorokiniana]